MRFYIKTITAAILLIGLSQAAHATCGVNGYWGSECGPQTPEPAPTAPGGDITNTLTGGNSRSTATGVGVGVGVGTGGNGYGGQGGAGGSSTATASGTGGAGGQGGAGGSIGDTTATSGSFGASIQTFGWGVTANRSKASNVCAAYAIAGPQGAIGYLAQQDPAFRSVALANGWAVKKSQVGKNAEPAPVAAPRQRITCPASHPNLRDVRGELRCYR